MSIAFELFKSIGKRPCSPGSRVDRCPMVINENSEDILTSNVFGLLKYLSPDVWLTPLLEHVFKGGAFQGIGHSNIKVTFWKKYRPPVNRKYREGISEVDVTISYKDGIIFIEAKYLAPVSLRTTSDVRRDQIIRYLDLAAYHYLNHPDGVKEFYFVLIIDSEKPPWILTRYRYIPNLIKGLTRPGFFRPPLDVGRLLSKGIGWLSWSQLKRILEITREEFQGKTEKGFVDDLILYLDYKIREAERIRAERKQLSFW